MSGGRILPLRIDGAYSIDIDTPLEWDQAEAVLEADALALVRPALRRAEALR